MKKRGIPKINSIHFGGRWIGIGVLIGGVIPFVMWLLFHVFLWGVCDWRNDIRGIYYCVCNRNASGFWRGWSKERESKYETMVLDWLDCQTFTILFVSGNHENFDRLSEYLVEQCAFGEYEEDLNALNYSNVMKNKESFT